MKTVFVTVGTTSFDELIESITSSEATQALKARGYERLVLQVGRGSVLPAADSCPHIRLEAFRFKNSIAEDISQADLVISHAGRAIRCPTQLMHSRPTHGDSLFHFYYL
ncbi:UDP-N-acetylglucosamine transferase subunit ALG13 homolog [Simochromis diagramma]|uniref:UDP-N-acetylglucosamine transferase subunit ALG13 homolog n=1 Tax=Simochromis diagramma TaxID=43689 RepID=UPI001A7E92FF|nr:UDP-N-acetylglucosamine transferase subunit ALG13 homolog [Simochromis diagramma]